MVGKKLDASQASIDSILTALNNLPIGELSAQLSIGVGGFLGPVKLAGDVVFSGSVRHDDDRRVRASVGVGFKVSGELDLKLWKASGSIAVTFSGTYVFHSPRHFAAWILSKLHEFQKTIEKYVGTKAGASAAGGRVQGKALPPLPQGADTEPAMSLSKTDVTVDGRVGPDPDKKKAFAKTGVLKGLEGSASYTAHTARRKDPKTGRDQVLEGWVAKGSVTVPASKWGSFKAEYSFTHNHPNPDQDGVFVDWWFQPATTSKTMRDKKLAAAQVALLTPNRAKPLLATATAQSAKLGSALSAQVVNPKSKLEAAPFGLHAQYNWDDHGVSVRFVRVEARAGIDLKGEIPLGASGLTGRLGFKAGVMAGVLEVLGTKTTLYVQNVYNGLKKRATFAEEWARWVAGHRTSLWEIFRSIALPQSIASKEVSAEVRTTAAKYATHLGTSVVFGRAFDDMLVSLTGHFDKAGNTAKGWKDQRDPKLPKPPVKWAKTTVTGAAGGKATLRGEDASDAVPTIKTLRDLHKDDWELRVEIPGVSSRIRGGPMSFKGRGTGLRRGFKEGLIAVFGMDFQLGKVLPQLIPREIANDPPRKIDGLQQAEPFLPMLDKILDSDASGLSFRTGDA